MRLTLHKPIKHVSILVLTGLLNYAYAQADCDPSILKEASNRYSKGDFEYILTENIVCLEQGYKSQEKIAALRLIAISHYALDNLEQSRGYAEQIVRLNPEYDADIFDPAFFKAAIDEAKRATSVNLVTSVSKKAENIDLAPATVSLITEQQIRRRGYNDLEAVLHDLPGFDISRTNGFLYSHIYQRGYRSVNTNRTLLLFDGVEENDLWSFNAYLSRQYSVANVKNIEVVYGPASTIYGANAFLGVVNVTTKNPEDYISEGEVFGMDVQGGYGSYNSRYIDGTFAVKSPTVPISLAVTTRVFASDEPDLSAYDNWDFGNDYTTQDYIEQLSITDISGIRSLLGERTTDHAYYTVERNALGDTTGVTLSQLGAERAMALDDAYYSNPATSFSDLTQTWSISSKIRLYDLLLGFSYWTKDEQTGSWYNDVRQGGGSYGENWSPRHQFFYIKYNKSINSSLSFQNFLRYKIHDFDQDTRLVGIRTYKNGRRSFAQLLDDTPHSVDSLYFYQNSKQLRNELKVIYSPNDKFDLVGGLETRFSSIQGDYVTSSTANPEETGSVSLSDPPLGGNQFNSRDIGIYAQASYRPHSIVGLTGGLRFDNNKIRRSGGYGSVLNPRVSVVLSPGRLIFKTIFAQAFLDANSRERFSTVEGQRDLPNPNLSPERVTNLEFSIGTNFLKNRLKADLTAYRADYSNIIQSQRVPYEDGSTLQNNNVGEQITHGIQANLSYRFAQWDFYANYTHTQSTVINPVDSNGDPIMIDGEAAGELEVGDIADHQVNFGINYLLATSLNLNLRGNFVGSRNTGPDTSVMDNLETFDPYLVLFGSASYQIIEQLMIQLTVNNLLNTEYQSPGIRDADNSRFASALPQNGINGSIRLQFSF